MVVSWESILGMLVFLGLVVLLWNSHHLTRWSRKSTSGGTVFENSFLDAPAWLENPWIGRVMAVLVIVMAGGALLARLGSGA